MRIMECAGALVRTVTEEHGSRGLQKDLHIQPERPRVRIFEIEPDHIVEPEPASPVDLPEAGQAGLHLQQPPAVPEVVGLDLIRNRRSAPGPTNTAPQNARKVR